MYNNPDIVQYSIYDFILPFGGHLNPNNRWVKLANEIDWKIVDEEYAKSFTKKDDGAEAYSSRIAFGSLYIQRAQKFTDRELVQQIVENPYLQYFLGYGEYSDQQPYDPSTLVYFRKRLNDKVMDKIIDRMFVPRSKGGSDNNKESGNSSGDSKPGPEDQKNSGTMIIDATCAPADIAYPTDLELCDKARRWTEVIVDSLYKEYGALSGSTKPRTYREKARIRFLNLNKRKKKSLKKIRKEIRFQLNCIDRNIGYIDSYFELHEEAERKLYPIMRSRLETIRKFTEQQRTMLDSRTHRINDRIVSLSQPWVRPIVRGKSKAPTEFGIKISLSVVNGYSYVDSQSFDAYNEGASDEFIKAVDQYVRRFGCYPERILADKIYRTRQNREYCKQHGIHLQGPKLGRPLAEDIEEVRQEYREIGERNAVEGKFGTCKRKLGMNRIMAKLQETTGSMIHMDVFVLNMEHLLRQKFSYAIIWLLEKTCDSELLALILAVE